MYIHFLKIETINILVFYEQFLSLSLTYYTHNVVLLKRHEIPG